MAPPLSPTLTYIHKHTLWDGIHTAMSTLESRAAEAPRWPSLARAARLRAEPQPEEENPSRAPAERAARPAAYPAQSGLRLHPQRPSQHHRASLRLNVENRDFLQQPSQQTAAAGTWARMRGWRPPTGGARRLHHIVTQAVPSAGRAGSARLGRRLPGSPKSAPSSSR